MVAKSSQADRDSNVAAKFIWLALDNKLLINISNQPMNLAVTYDANTIDVQPVKTLPPVY